MIVLSLVLFLALPLSVLVLVDHMRFKSEIRAESRAEVKKMRELRKQLEEEVKKEK